MELDNCESIFFIPESFREAALNEIKCYSVDGLPEHKTVHPYTNWLEESNYQNPTKICSSVMGDFDRALNSHKLDVLFILGDRYEALALSLVTVLKSVKIAHIHGGETSAGSMDDRFRHAITKLSDFHFVSHEEHARRVRRLGAIPHNVFDVGSLGVERVKKMSLLSPEQLDATLGIKLANRNILVTFHPETEERDFGLGNFSVLLEVLAEIDGLNTFFSTPNSDPAGEKLMEKIREACTDHSERFHVLRNMGQVGYLSLAKACNCVCGNSSSGLIELPAIGANVLDLGLRQKGRRADDRVVRLAEYTRTRLKKALVDLMDKNTHGEKSISGPFERAVLASKLIVDETVRILTQKCERELGQHLNQDFYKQGRC